MNKRAFTLLEVVFVIVIIGILAALAIPNQKSNMLHKAAEQVANHIRYTQHLAMVDDQFSPNDQTWYKKRWQIRFLNNGTIKYYDIFSDQNKEGNSNANEEAVDPMTKERLGSGNTLNTPKEGVNLTRRYGISSIQGTCEVDGTRKIGFDYFGRPYLGVSGGIYTNPVPAGGCTIQLVHPLEGTATIKIAAISGYVSISY